MNYPFAHHLSLAPTLAHSDGSFYHFGGMMRLNSQEELKTTSPFIASYSPITDQWTMRGELKTARSASSVIWTESAFLVLGGGLHGSISPGPNLPEKGEKCEFNDSNQIVCTLQDIESTSKLLLDKITSFILLFQVGAFHSQHLVGTVVFRQ